MKTIENPMETEKRREHILQKEDKQMANKR